MGDYTVRLNATRTTVACFELLPLRLEISDGPTTIDFGLENHPRMAAQFVEGGPMRLVVLRDPAADYPPPGGPLSPWPYRIVFRVGEGSTGSVRVLPRRGPTVVAQAVDVKPRSLFIAAAAGEFTLEVHAVPKPPDGSGTWANAETGPSEDSDSVTFTIVRAVVRPTVPPPPITIDVGDEVFVPLHPALYNPVTEARLGANDGQHYLDVANWMSMITSLRMDPLTATFEAVSIRTGQIENGTIVYLPVAYGLVYSHAGGPLSPVTFVPPVGPIALDDGRVKLDAPRQNCRFLRGRRPGTATILVHATAPGFSNQIDTDPEVTTITVEVRPKQPRLNVTPDYVQGTGPANRLMVASDWDEDAGALRGSLRIDVQATDTTATQDGTLVPYPHVLYDSLTRTQVSGRLAGNTMVLEAIVPLEPAENSSHHRTQTRRSFEIELTIDNPSILSFELPGVQLGANGTFTIYEPLRRFLKATGSGTTDVTVRLKRIPEPLPDELLEYDVTSAVRQVTVEIPKPLVAHLDVWSDDHFGSTPGADAIDLTTPGPLGPLIYDHGEVSGRVEHFDPAIANLDRVELVIQRPGFLDEVVDLRAAGWLEDDGSFAGPIGELRHLANDPINRLILRAWRPVNLAVDGAPSEATADLEATRPTISNVGTLSVGPEIVRRDIGSLTYEYGLATSAKVVESPVSGGDPLDLTSLRPVAYDPRSVTTPAMEVRDALGARRIAIVAENDFGRTVHEVAILTAAMPTLTLGEVVPSSAPSLPPEIALEDARDPNDSRRVGHHVEKVTLSFVVRFAHTLRGGEITDVDEPLPAPGNPMQASNRSVVLPFDLATLADGNNAFRLIARNDFDEVSRDITIHRRGNTFVSISARFEMETTDPNGTVSVSWRLNDDEPARFNQGSPDLSVTVPTDVESSRPDLLSWSVELLDADGNAAPESVNHFESQTGWIRGPDYESRRAFLIVPEDWVADHADNLRATFAPAQSLNMGAWVKFLSNNAVRQGGEIHGGTVIG
jgi:hypothetical protein